MGTHKRSAWLAGLAILLAGPAFADPPELDAAIDAYLESDYSQLSLIRTYAEAGEADALSVMGQAYLYGLGADKDPARGVAYFEKAAEAGDWPAANQLGRIYTYGDAGQQKDLDKAARYFVRAAELGDPAGRKRLADLPRDRVIAAGGARFLAPADTPPPAKAEPLPPLLPPAPAQPQQQTISRLDAITAYVQDGTHGDVVLANARAGDADSARVLGRDCLRDGKCPSTRKEAHDLLVKAAQTDASAAAALGAIYRDGAWGGTVHMVPAAQWIGHAHKLGLDSAKYMLEDLPREAVREAGYEQVLIDLEASDAARAAPPPKTAPARSEDPKALANTLADAIFGTGTAPPPLRLNDGRPFPIFADTALSDMGDGAASCFLVMLPALDALEAEYIALAETTRNQSDIAKLGTLSRLSVMEMELDVMQMYAEMARDSLNNPDRNGGFSGDDLTWEVAKHQRAMDTRPGSGPSAEFCSDNLVKLIVTTTVP